MSDLVSPDWALPGERVRYVPGWERQYAVTTYGRLWRYAFGPVHEGRFVKGGDRNGYVLASLCRPGEQWGVGIHQLVMLAFEGPPLPGKTVNHIDRVRSNNRYENLEYATRDEQDENKDRSGCTSRFRGVSWDSHNRKWCAKLDRCHLGLFPTELQAARAYNEAKLAKYGPDTILNVLPQEDADLE